MKILSITSNFNSIKKAQNQPQHNISSPIQAQSQHMELTNIDTVGRSLLSFKAQPEIKDNLDLKSKTIEELQELKEYYQANQKEIDQRKSEARARLDKIANWNYSKEYENQRLNAEAEITKKDLSRFWNPFKCSEIKEKHFYAFQAKDREIDVLKQNKNVDEAIINSTPLNDAQAKSVVGAIDYMIIQKQENEKTNARIKSIDDVQSAINDMNNARGGLKDRVAGYDYEKSELRRIFTGTLAKAKDDPETEVPSCIMLHGASGTGKTTIIRAIGRESFEAGEAKVVDLSPSVRGDSFMDEVERELRSAKNRYYEEDENGKPKRTRTILLINDAERFLGMPLEQAKKVYGNLIDENDEARINSFNHELNYKSIDKFKSLLDLCSEVPDCSDDNSDRAATTIFITTNYPHLIDRDVLRKLQYIAINPAKNKNLEAVVKHYFERSSKVIEEIKRVASDPNFESYNLKHLKDVLNSDSVEKIVQMVEEGTIDQLTIPFENIPYENIAKDYNPTPSKGAFDNKQIQEFSKTALNEYIQNPKRPFYGHFYSQMFNEPRKIDPARYKHFIDIYNALAPLNKREGDDMKVFAAREKELLLKMEKAGALGDEDRKKLDYIISNEAEELRYLESREKSKTITEVEKMRLDELKKPNIVQDNNEDDE